MLLYNEPQVNMLNNIHLNSEYSYIGTVCGMDIKPIPKLSPGEGYTRLNQTPRFGVFLYVKMPNGDRYDLIWNLVGSIRDSKHNKGELYKDGRTSLWTNRETITVFVNDICSIHRLKAGLSYLGPKAIKRLLKGKLKASDAIEFKVNRVPLIPNLFELLRVDSLNKIVGKKIKVLPFPFIADDMSMISLQDSSKVYVLVAPVDQECVSSYGFIRFDPLSNIQPDIFEVHTSDPNTAQVLQTYAERCCIMQ